MPAQPTVPQVLRIHKVRRTRKRIFIDYARGSENLTLESSDKPLIAFNTALDALGALVVAVCYLPETYAETLKVSGFTLTEKNMVTLQAVKSLPVGGAFNIATPLRFLDLPKVPGEYSDRLTDEQVALVDAAVEEAKAYVIGKRDQGQLSLDDDEDDGEAEAANHAEDTAKSNQLAFAPDAGTSGKPAKKSKGGAAAGK